MREIQFRGKRLCDGKWAYGSLIRLRNGYEIFTDSGEYKSASAVKSDTIGQYTGSDDKNGKLIFEGDIVELKTIPFDDYDSELVGRSKVVFQNGGFDFEKIFDRVPNFAFFGSVKLEATVIGNIYDNPELLTPGVK